VALAVLFVLALRHGLEIKRLREWAGRAPERAAEEQNRVRAEASLRAGQSAAHEYRRSDTRRSRVRLAVLIAGALVVVGVVVIGAQGSQGGSSASASSPRVMRVAVLNGTSITGLGHRLSEMLHKAGYSKSTVLDGQPPGTYTVTLVEYKRGNRAAAEAVARDLRVTRVEAMSSGLSLLARSATVAVVAGDDQAHR
jgi:LytR cell envelope-related transcriptional attenuator